MPTLSRLGIVLAALALAACGGDVSGPAEYRGYLVDDGTAVRLCEMLAESHPPQCGGTALRVEGELPDVEWSEAEGVRWTDEQVIIPGTVEGDVLRPIEP